MDWTGGVLYLVGTIARGLGGGESAWFWLFGGMLVFTVLQLKRLTAASAPSRDIGWPFRGPPESKERPVDGLSTDERLARSKEGRAGVVPPYVVQLKRLSKSCSPRTISATLSQSVPHEGGGLRLCRGGRDAIF